ncbi:CGNR zinc finger domain-containing protein [Streptomyces sp. RY43-2]|uniref:CGNR zinc finger domain-containing protein n=1 Tax=Streptomyces macrolidinus TaxID=2952607 RepID=A0ABT0ZLS5_9ACTN|nr:CGNR zinc finger domain-containing protein [Streptomyces macrolidinus]MCN9244535.1 CGNR zinc finger domain-containing protein [Streptomyces macrolidinus]
MLFDSHMRALLDASVALVNALTDGEARGRPYIAPEGAERVGAVRAALSAGADLEPGEADYLADTARALRTVFEAVAADNLDGAAPALNTLLRETGARPQLDRAPGEPWQVHFHGADDSYAVGWSAGCATGLAMALGGDYAGRLGVCAAPRCDRVYVDTSRNAGRQFCSTACQNRVKAAAFRARRASDDT